MSDDLDALLRRLQACRRVVNAAPARLRVGLEAACSLSDSGAEWLSMGRVLELACEAFEMRPLELVPWPLVKPSAAERLLERALDLSSFARARAAPAVSRAEALAEIEDVMERDPLRRFRVRAVRSASGAMLKVFEAGPTDAEPWLLVLPYGVPAELSFALAQQVSREFRFVTFEGPDLVSTVEEFDLCTHGVDAHADDIAAVVDSLGVERVHLSGVCAGVIPCLRFAHSRPNRLSTLMLGNGAYQTRERTPEDFVALANRIGGRRDKARVFFKFMSSQDLSVREPEYPQLTMVPYCSADLLYKFTTSFKSYYDGDLGRQLDVWIASVAAPTLVVIGERDTLTPPESSREVARKLRNSQLLVDADGTHLSMMGDPNPRVLEAMLSFCREHTAPQS